jgi:anaerobic dimethyl sulfoxide reductase subunit A
VEPFRGAAAFAPVVAYQSGSCCSDVLALGSGQRLARSFWVTMPARTPRAIASRNTRTSAVNTAIFADLAARLGINNYHEKTEEQWLRELTADAVDDLDAFAANGVARFAPPRDAEAFAAQIRDPDTTKFTTPSGKIEIYSMAFAARPDPYGLGVIPPIPTWIDPVTPDARYPLMLCSPKSRARTHSIHGNQPLLARVDPDDVWMNTEDAAQRGIANGQKVRVFNDRGSTVLPVKVTRRIAPGVVSIKEGAWFTPDADGTDTKGCANVLAEDRSVPCGATTYNTNLVEVAVAD